MGDVWGAGEGQEGKGELGWVDGNMDGDWGWGMGVGGWRCGMSWEGGCGLWVEGGVD